MRRLLAPCIAATSSFSFKWSASESLFCVRWMRNTIRNVMIVVPVLMTSCHVSEKPNSGPSAAQIKMQRQDATKVNGLPVALATLSDILPKTADTDIGHLILVADRRTGDHAIVS